MDSYQSVWEDDETNRKVELLVNYSQDDAGVTIEDITPTKVTFLDPATKADLRSIGIWTKTGRKILVRQFRSAGRVEALEQEIASMGLASTGT
jgi:hypothetical protein